MSSLDEDSDREAAWDTVAAERNADLESGRVQGAPLADALTRLRSGLGA
jgi:hypothetical protein